MASNWLQETNRLLQIEVQLQFSATADWLIFDKSTQIGEQAKQQIVWLLSGAKTTQMHIDHENVNFLGINWTVLLATVCIGSDKIDRPSIGRTWRAHNKPIY